MSSSYTKRYQSRLLNFISEQSHKVVDKFDLALRHLKFAAEGALQASLYPVYLLLQTARTISLRFQPAETTSASQLPESVPEESKNPLETDRPIQRVLSFLKKLSLPAATTEPTLPEIPDINPQGKVTFATPNLGENGQADLPVFKDLIATSADRLTKLDKPSNSGILALGPAPEIPLSHQPQILGIATAIASRTLVMVAPENQTLDILTAQQQTELQAEILSEVAAYWQQRQLQAQSPEQFTTDLRLVANQANLFPLLRPFVGVMAWVQTSPLAVKVNLFGEAKLPRTSYNGKIPITNYQLGLGTGNYQLPIPSLQFTNVQFTNGEKGKVPLPIINPLLAKAEKGKIPFPIPNPPPTEGQEEMPLPITNPILTKGEQQARQFAIASTSLPETTETESPQPPIADYIKYSQLSSTAFLQTQQKSAEIANLEPESAQLLGIEKFEDKFEQVVEAIVSAVDYFFDSKTAQNEKELAAGIYAKYSESPPSIPQLEAVEAVESDRPHEQSWLTWSALFGEISLTPNIAEDNHPPAEINLVSALTRVPSYEPPSETEELNPIFVTVQATAASSYAPSSKSEELKPASVKAQPARSQNITKVNTSFTSKTQQTTTAVTRKEPATNSSVKATPDWWEARVISRGYIKHPLEQALEWVDIAMLWLEEVGLAIWNWGKTQLDKIFNSKN
ncbi:hypothetical protein PN499_15120 [Kamptonema animale CS-326]|jgi:hypothetical protein|uniref:hypothetical protein n=1 Tax=Kamptonema animale TaxID=92934 RepID=UPI00232DF373|nr:hypothetical protein [Kamptonema animale]MDB9512521.1 hypothetical protein [Kamptonema animale CS-326]